MTSRAHLCGPLCRFSEGSSAAPKPVSFPGPGHTACCRVHRFSRRASDGRSECAAKSRLTRLPKPCDTLEELRRSRGGVSPRSRGPAFLGRQPYHSVRPCFSLTSRTPLTVEGAGGGTLT